MKSKFILPILLTIVFVGNSRAQQMSKTFSIHFNIDEFTLDKNDETVLDELIAATLPSSYYEIEMTAHTDNDATDNYNINLSNKRANSVKTYLLTHQLNNQFISSAAYGERKPKVANKNIESKAINRRVDLALTTFKANSIGDLLKQAAPEYKQIFTIDATKTNTIKGKNGTLIYIPANTLLTKNGTPANGTVTIELQEYLKPVDAAFNELSTISNGQMLESGGMFKVAAAANGEDLTLKTGEILKVEMPTINMRNNMSLFTEVKNEQGISEWKKTTTEFRPKGEEKKTPPFLKLNTKYLASLLVNNIAEKQEFQNIYKLPNVPKRPAKMGKKPVFIAPTAKEQFSWLERLFYPNSYINKRLNIETERRQKSFDRNMVVYKTKKEKYDNNMAKFIADSTNFETGEKEKLNAWLDKAKAINLANIEVLKHAQWNSGINKLIAKSNKNEINMVNVKGFFYTSLFRNHEVRNELSCLKFIIESIDKFKDLSVAKVYELCGHKNEVNFDVYFQKHYYNGESNNEFINEQMANNPGFNQLLIKAGSDILELRDQARIFDEASVGSVYTTSLSGFGTFNCDRFSNTPKNQMATIKVPYKENANVSFFVPSLNSYMYANRTSEGYEAEIPKDLLVKVIFVAFNKTEGPLVQIQKTKFSRNTTLSVKPESVNLKGMKQMLATI